MQDSLPYEMSTGRKNSGFYITYSKGMSSPHLQVSEAGQLRRVVRQRHALVVRRRDARPVVRHLYELAAAFPESYLRFCIVHISAAALVVPSGHAAVV